MSAYPDGNLAALSRFEDEQDRLDALESDWQTSDALVEAEHEALDDAYRVIHDQDRLRELRVDYELPEIDSPTARALRALPTVIAWASGLDFVPPHLDAMTTALSQIEALYLDRAKSAYSERLIERRREQFFEEFNSQ